MGTQETTTQPTATLERADDTLLLWRGVAFSEGTERYCTGDRLIIRYKRGGLDEDVLISGFGAQRTVKRLVLNVQGGVSGYYFVDVEAADVKGLLDAYRIFDGK